MKTPERVYGPYTILGLQWDMVFGLSMPVELEQDQASTSPGKLCHRKDPKSPGTEMEQLTQRLLCGLCREVFKVSSSTV